MPPPLHPVPDLRRVVPAHRVQHCLRVLHAACRHRQQRQTPPNGTFPLGPKGARSTHQFGQPATTAGVGRPGAWRRRSGRISCAVRTGHAARQGTRRRVRIPHAQQGPIGQSGPPSDRPDNRRYGGAKPQASRAQPRQSARFSPHASSSPAWRNETFARYTWLPSSLRRWNIVSCVARRDAGETASGPACLGPCVTVYGTTKRNIGETALAAGCVIIVVRPTERRAPRDTGQRRRRLGAAATCGTSSPR